MYLLWIMFLCEINFYVCGIHLRRILIPEQIQLGDAVYLICDFQLEQRETLYSVKWYKNNMEFYRYINSSLSATLDRKDFTIFSQLGIYLDKRKSNTSHVLLKKSDLNTEGTYGCEVSTNTFSTVIAEKDLKIFVQPKHSMKFIVTKNDKQINAICQTSASKPPNLIYFLLNGQLLKQPIYDYLELGKLITTRTTEGLISSFLNVRFFTNQLVTISQIINNDAYYDYKPFNNLNSHTSSHLIAQQRLPYRNQIHSKQSNSKQIENFNWHQTNNNTASSNNLLNSIQIEKNANKFKQVKLNSKFANARQFQIEQDFFSLTSHHLNTLNKLNSNQNFLLNQDNFHLSSSKHLNKINLKSNPFSSSSNLPNPQIENLIKQAKQSYYVQQNQSPTTTLNPTPSLNLDNLNGLTLSCVSSIAQPIATTYAELNLEENTYLENNYHENSINTNIDLSNNLLLQDDFLAPRIITKGHHSISPGLFFEANCTVNMLHQNSDRMQPLLKWFINEREANIDELMLYHNKELYDENVRNFASNYQAYILSYGDALRTSLKENQLTSERSLYRRNASSFTYHHDRWMHNKFKIKKFDSIKIGLRLHLSKEHFQTIDGSIKLRCTCTYSTLLRQEIQSVPLFNNGKSLLWLATNAKQSFKLYNLLLVCASNALIHCLVIRFIL